MATVLEDSANSSVGRQKYFHPRRLGHVNLWVNDVDRSEKFYNSYCGLSVEFTEPELIATFLGTGHTPHDLGMMQVTNGVDRYGKDGLLQLPGTVGLSPGLNHLAWELVNEKVLVDGFRAMKANGLEIDMTVSHGVAHSVYVFDPDRNYNEYYCDTVHDWRSAVTGKIGLHTGAWDPLTAEGFLDSRFDENPTLSVVDGAFIHPQRLTHSVLYTKQLDKLEAFYTTIGGLSVVSRQKDKAGRTALYFASSLPTYNYCLIVADADAPRFGNSAFELKSEAALQEAIAKLKKSQVKIETEVDLPWKASFYLKDPDGLSSEYYVRRNQPMDIVARGTVPFEFAL